MRRHHIFRYATSPGLVSSVESLPHTSHPTLDRLRRHDLTLRVPSRDGLLRISFCSSAVLLFETIWRHRVLAERPLNFPFLNLVGTHLNLTNLLASFQEGEERVRCHFAAREMTIVTEALALGECRCYFQHNPEYAPAESSAPFPLKVDRILYNQSKPFTSVVNADLARLKTCEIISHSLDGSDSACINSLDEIIPLLKKSDLETSSSLFPSSPLFGLKGIQSVNSDTLKAFFDYNISLHGYNLFRQSEGCSAVVFAHTSLLEQRIEELTMALMSEISKDEALTLAQNVDLNEKNKAKWLDTLPSLVPLSFGVVVQPLAASNRIEWQLWLLQSTLMQASLALMTSKTGVDNLPHNILFLKPLFDRCAETHATCQYILSLITGDYNGAHAVSEKARQYTHPVEEVATIVEPIRRALEINGIFIELEASAAVRTRLDFFCRCSTANLLQGLENAPVDSLRELMSTNDFCCTYCGKALRPTPEEWNHLIERRVKQD
ncbi:unnamed protein product [Phytomonas sp. Hart1]|nr:unnamed protein product [Phytomonas sp. Hart1]|eukprot:CCW68054.1 unnamed protein product [Phytomonas sp. isolate Hart1]